MYDQKWDIFQLGIVLWSLFCDAAHPYEIDSDTLRTIQNPTTPSRLLSALWTMQTKNIGIPSAIEWEELQNFRIPNVQINMQDEQTRISLMNQLRDVIIGIPDYESDFLNAEYDSKTKRCELIIKRIKHKRINTVENEEDDETFNENLNFLRQNCPELIQTDPNGSNYVSILADMLHFVPESRFSAVQALSKFRNLFTHVFLTSGQFSISEFHGRFPELAFLASLNLTKFSSDVTFSNFEKTIRRFSGVSSTIEVMPAPDRIYVPDEFTRPPNSHVMHVGMKAVKMFVEKELETEHDFLESLLNNINESNQEAAKTGFLQKLRALLPFTWSEEMVQDWLHDESSKHHARHPESQPVFYSRFYITWPVLKAVF